jgi:hypothetical protein
MNSKWILPLALLAAVACGKDNDKRTQQQEFETVEEGSAAGVTANLSGPGESLPPITSTNADTTSAFAIDPNVAPTATQPEVMAGTLPLPPMTSASKPIYVPPVQTTPRPVTPEPKPEPEPVQPPPTNTDTATTQPPPPTQTDTAPPPEDAPEEPTTKTDTTATEAPPPPPPYAAPRSAGL